MIAPWLFGAPIDWIMDRISEYGGIEIGPTKMTDLDYADDTAIFCKDPAAWPVLLTSFQTEAATVGLRPSWPKTMVQNLGAGPKPADVNVAGEVVQAVESFIYLGSTIHSSGYCEPEMRRRIGMAGSTLNQLDRVWRQRRLRLATKLRIYQACVLSVLLYGSETWVMLKEDQRRIQAFHMSCQGRLLGIIWYHRVTNEEVARRTGLQSIMEIIQDKQLRFFGHVRRMDPRTPAHQALHLAVRFADGWRPDNTWRRPVGRPRHTWVKQLCSWSGLTPSEAWEAAADRETWRALRPFAGQAP